MNNPKNRRIGTFYCGESFGYKLELEKGMKYVLAIFGNFN